MEALGATTVLADIGEPGTAGLADALLQLGLGLDQLACEELGKIANKSIRERSARMKKIDGLRVPGQRHRCWHWHWHWHWPRTGK